MRQLAIFICFCLVTPIASASFTYNDLVALIKNNNVTNIETLLPLLPESFRAQYTLMRESRSLQGATALHPRVILFGEDASLTCTFNGSEAEIGFDQIECFQFLKSEKRFEFRQIQFPYPGNGLEKVAFSQANLSADEKVSCTTCHGFDPRPNWNSYRIWKGAYGEDDDRLKFGDETNKYAQFVQQRPNHPRYKWLVQLDDPAAPYNHSTKDSMLGRPNLVFSDLVGRMNSIRGARLLQSQVEEWRALGWAVRALDCRLTREQSEKVANAGLNFYADTDLLKTFQSLRIHPNIWSTQFYGDKHSNPTTDYDHQSGYCFLSEDVALAILNDRAANGDVALADAFQKFTWSNYDAGQDRLFKLLHSMVPFFDHFGQMGSNRERVCPRITEIFTEAYLRSHIQ